MQLVEQEPLSGRFGYSDLKSHFEQVRLEVAGSMGRHHKPADFDLTQYLKVWGLLWGVPAWKGL
jgi:hypothetical protein